MAGPQEAWVGERLARWQTQRDAAALGELLKWQRGRAYATALRLLGRSEDAEDAVQQGFLKLLGLKKGFAEQRAFENAVYWAVTQCALNLAASRRSRQKLENAMGYAEKKYAETPLALAERAEALRALEEELAQLDDPSRAAVVLCCQEGLTVTEAAAALEESRETTRDRLARTLGHVREQLKRKGVTFSGLMLISLLRDSRATGVPETLCRALDAHLQGAPCAAIEPAGATSVTPAQIAAEAGLRASNAQLAAFAALLGLLIAGIAVSFVVGQPATPQTPPAANVSTEKAKPSETSFVGSTAENNKQEENVMKRNVGLIAAAAAGALIGVAQAGDGDKPAAPQRKVISREEIKAAVRAVLASDKQSDAKSEEKSMEKGPVIIRINEIDAVIRERD